MRHLARLAHRGGDDRGCPGVGNCGAPPATRSCVRRRLEPCRSGRHSGRVFRGKRSASVQISWTPSSAYLIRCSTTASTSRSPIDNVVAYQEGQGEREIAGTADSSRSSADDSGFRPRSMAAPADDAISRAQRGLTDPSRSAATTTGYALSSAASGCSRDPTVSRRTGRQPTSAPVERPTATAELLAGKHDATLAARLLELLARESAAAISQLATAEASLGALSGETVGAAMALAGLERPRARSGSVAVRAYRAGALTWLYDRGPTAPSSKTLLDRQHPRHDACAGEAIPRPAARRQGRHHARRRRSTWTASVSVLALRSKYGAPRRRLPIRRSTSISRTTRRRSASAEQPEESKREWRKRSSGRAEGRPARRHRSAPQLGPAVGSARPHAGRFRGARQLPAAARLPPRARARGARELGPGRAAVASTSTTSATPRAPSSASGRATS